ncbi:MAG: hypothetical protein FP826_08995 [Sphingomonadales bacterium]|nr:hypothetical protein [Sphingomonadales bacterium]
MSAMEASRNFGYIESMPHDNLAENRAGSEVLDLSVEFEAVEEGSQAAPQSPTPVRRADIFLLEQEVVSDEGLLQHETKFADPCIKVFVGQDRTRPSVTQPSVTRPAEPVIDLVDLSKPANTRVALLSSFPTTELTRQLEDARKSAVEARTSEDRSHDVLYRTIERAYDFALAAAEAPAEFAAIVEEAGLVMQDRAPMTPIVKLVFGAEYDKTRLAEYATALAYAKRAGVKRGVFSDYLRRAPGGLKSVVQAERRLRRQESGKAISARTEPKASLVKQLRELPMGLLGDLPEDGDEFVLVVARRLPGGKVALLGEVPRDIPMLERAANQMLGKLR